MNVNERLAEAARLMGAAFREVVLAVGELYNSLGLNLAKVYRRMYGDKSDNAKHLRRRRGWKLKKSLKEGKT